MLCVVEVLPLNVFRQALILRMVMVLVNAALPNCLQTNDACSNVVGEKHNGTSFKIYWELLASVLTSGGDYKFTESVELFDGSNLASDFRIASDEPLSTICRAF